MRLHSEADIEMVSLNRDVIDGVDDVDDVLLDKIASPHQLTPRLILLVFLSAIGGFMFGYDTSVISGALLLLKREFSL